VTRCREQINVGAYALGVSPWRRKASGTLAVTVGHVDLLVLP
jgi:hypothetical protein